jgi:hypothetical protein
LNTPSNNNTISIVGNGYTFRSLFRPSSDQALFRSKEKMTNTRLSVRTGRDPVPLTSGLIYGHRKYLPSENEPLSLTNTSRLFGSKDFLDTCYESQDLHNGSCRVQYTDFFSCLHTFFNNNISVLSKQRLFHLPYNFLNKFHQVPSRRRIPPHSHTKTIV